MRYVRLFTAVALLLYPLSSAFAACPDRNDYNLWTGPYSIFSFDTSCGSASGDVTTATMSCFTWSADQFTPGNGSVDYSMTVPNDLTSGPWYVRTYVDFSDPSAYQGNGLSASVTVWHNGSVSYWDGFFFHNGTQGSMECEMVTSSGFTAYAGDTITVSLTGNNYNTGATMKMTPPQIEWH